MKTKTTLTAADLQALVELLKESNEAAAVGAERLHDVHCKVRWQKRAVLLVLMLVCGYTVDHLVLHWEAVHEGVKLGIDGISAVVVEKFCFGVAEA